MNKYIDKIVVIELESGDIYEGALEDADGGYVKITKGAEVYHLPRHEIFEIKLVPSFGFTYE
ncbi:hypothetical protein ACFSTH_16980 [Paenibacillus yanchengensis]|uniref:Uncharacterized protein n=1 Tax=Paenibacillus yanchengensis TaxID=2035833 RepID=A0ABW4YQS8_9BACL